jgi:hypothetical protein
VPSTHDPNACRRKTLCRGYWGQGPRLDPTKGRHKNSGPRTVSTTPLNLALMGSHFFPTTPCPVPMITSTRSSYLNFCPLYIANNSPPNPGEGTGSRRGGGRVSGTWMGELGTDSGTRRGKRSRQGAREARPAKVGKRTETGRDERISGRGRSR